jgi:hypothetical protein
MSLITNVIQSTLHKPLVHFNINLFKKSIFRPRVITKNFINLEPTANAYYTLSSAFEPVGDYILECDILQNGGLGSDSQVIFGSPDDSSTYIGTLPDGFIRFRPRGGGVTIEIPAPFLNSTKLIKFKAVSVNDVVTVSLSGTTIATFTESRKPKIAIIGNYNLPSEHSLWDGILSKPRLIDNVTPANSLSFELNNLTGDIEYPADNVFGSELWDYGTIVADGTTPQFVPIAGDTLGDFDVESTYIAKVEWVNLTGSIRFNAGADRYSTGNLSNNTGSAEFVTVFSNGDTPRLNVQELSPTGSTAVSVTFSVKKVTNALTYVNIAETVDVRDTFNEVDGGWLGSEKSQSLYSDLGTWVDNNDGSYRNSLTVGFSRMRGDNISSGFYRMEVRIVSTPNVGKYNLNIKVGNEKIGVEYNAPAGFYEIEGYLNEGGLSFVSEATTLGEQVTVSDLSLKRLIEVAS